ncbi:MAG: hypothetical protein D6725_03330 [Planctomycetota bacterium]|nr:MAG: hypothetical protein D6725_03330 [Planctomycetota bacterium]
MFARRGKGRKRGREQIQKAAFRRPAVVGRLTRKNSEKKVVSLSEKVRNHEVRLLARHLLE